MLKKMNKNLSEIKESQQYKTVFWVLLSIVSVISALFIFPSDDGLRHVGLAFGNLTSWGDVYPYSIFEQFKDYDPWYGYDLSLKVIAGILKLLPFSTLTLSFALIKTLAVIFTLLFFWVVTSRSGILDEIKDQNTFTLAVILLLALLSLPAARVMTLRPFIFGTLYLIYTIGSKGFVRGALSSLILTFFYPYLSWFYILPVVLTHFIKGDKKFAIGALITIILFLIMQPPSFWGFQVALLNSDSLRQDITPKIGEFTLTFKMSIFYFYLVSLVFLFPKFSDKCACLNYSTLLILIYFAPALKYIRYFYDLILPLLFVSFGKEILQILHEPFNKMIFAWRSLIQSYLLNIQLLLKFNSKIRPSRNHISDSKPEMNLKPYIAVCYSLIFAMLVFLNLQQVNNLKSFRETLSSVPLTSLVLSGFNLQYKLLFIRPDLRIIPSCEVVFATQYIAKEYSDFFNKGLIFPLAEKIGTKYFIDDKKNYIDPREGKYLKYLKDSDELRIWQVLKQKES